MHQLHAGAAICRTRRNVDLHIVFYSGPLVLLCENRRYPQNRK